MKLTTRYELASKSVRDLRGLYRQVFNALVQSAPGSAYRRNALVSLENISRETNQRHSDLFSPRLNSRWPNKWVKTNTGVNFLSFDVINGGMSARPALQNLASRLHRRQPVYHPSDLEMAGLCRDPGIDRLVQSWAWIRYAGFLEAGVPTHLRKRERPRLPAVEPASFISLSSLPVFQLLQIQILLWYCWLANLLSALPWGLKALFYPYVMFSGMGGQFLTQLAQAQGKALR